MKFLKKIEITVELLIVSVFVVLLIIYIPNLVRYNRYLRYSRICDAVADYARMENELPPDLKSLCDWSNSQSNREVWAVSQLQKCVRFEWEWDPFPKNSYSNIEEIVFISIQEDKMKEQEEYFNNRLRGLVKKEILKKSFTNKKNERFIK